MYRLAMVSMAIG